MDGDGHRLIGGEGAGAKISIPGGPPETNNHKFSNFSLSTWETNQKLVLQDDTR